MARRLLRLFMWEMMGAWIRVTAVEMKRGGLRICFESRVSGVSGQFGDGESEREVQDCAKVLA